MVVIWHALVVPNMTTASLLMVRRNPKPDGASHHRRQAASTWTKVPADTHQECRSSIWSGGHW